MDKDLLKGLLFVVGAIVLVVGLFFVFSDDSSDKASCIARALKEGVAYGNIDKVCNLSKRS
jgi:hypothetical protein